jgi:peptidoglycan lytic transglycosylase D
VRRPFSYALALALVAATACASHGGGKVSPATPQREPSVEVTPSEHPPLPDAPSDTLAIMLRDSLLERRLSQDSAADAAILEQLANARPPAEAPPIQSGDPLDALSDSRALSLDLTTYAEHERVRYYLDFFQGPARSRMAVWLQRMPVYESLVRERFQAAGLPSDLVYLGLIESGFSNVAVSRSRAVGMWQFMRKTARGMGLRVDKWVDERRDPVKSTDAAARYLAILTQQFNGSYYLAAAAYNAGPGRVSRGLSRLGTTVGPGGSEDTDDSEEEDEEEGLSDGHFFSLADTRYIRRETKDYVPKLIAAGLIARHPETYGFPPMPAAEPFPRDSLVVHDLTGLDIIARLAGVPTTTIRELNPHYLRRATPPGKVSVVRLPAGTQSHVGQAYAALPVKERAGASATRYRDADAAAARGRVHVVRSGETLGSIAEDYRVSVSSLRRWNGLGKSNLIRVGQRLRISSGQVAATDSSSSPGSADRPTIHVVKRGETLSSLAKRYGVSIQTLMTTNDLSSSRLRAGQKLRIPA